ncbi:HAD-superfamily hydrolase [Macrolepiota fuliginosa MF-IS2]|uniref:HAD-superfamily hydrolase n=1 Tax=Macrolepiota fuliginosa MF-IS2 TaxID=1400762 RepID=A0A9P6C6R2_9AGAR|nr:HAD-superfamily hydrolase [Macrolepiota fuliginosa MF-IS2]
MLVRPLSAALRRNIYWGCQRYAGFHSTPSYLPTATPPPPPLAFCFDIDGVLIRGPHVLPAAKRALSILEGDNPFKCKIPYILLTNGGGVSEQIRCQKLTEQLGFPASFIQIEEDQYIQAHTVLKTLAHKYAKKPVLIFGGRLDALRKVAQSYGFEQAYTTLDVLASNQSVWPFHSLTDLEKEATEVVDLERTRFAAAFVFHDPRDWALDCQILCDIIQSDGIVGGPYVDPKKNQDPVELVFCNPDLLWKSEFPRPRLGQGGFKAAFQGVYHALTGTHYPHMQFGKPSRETYKFAEEVLVKRLHNLYGTQNLSPHIDYYRSADIAGANAAGWYSVLVRTGVYEREFGGPTHIPTHETADVEAAVQWAIMREQERIATALS